MGGASGSEETGLASEPTLRARDAVLRELVPGDVVGRYVVLAKLGAGGMGVVYAAYDPELDRKVALKLLRSDGASEGASRLLREAQALAKLSHPHVVGVHDVGTRDDQVWLAMEFVDGETLAQWRKAAPRSWHDVLEVMRPAAIGLAAAHEVGLVHRDVKPDNVMVGVDGRVRMMDFGLARGMRGMDSSEAVPIVDDSTTTGRRLLDTAVTRAGAMPGTPAYMAPEQIARLSTDARSDQFSLCVMFWEALYGERPFGGATLVELASNILESRRRAPPRDVRIPRWIRAVVERGLAAAPEARWPSVSALLAALEAGRRRALVVRLVAGLAVIAIVVGTVLGVRHLDERRRVATCTAAGNAIDEVWNDDERIAVRDALIATNASYAATTADNVMPWLDDRAAAWRAARTQTCLDAELDPTWTADLVDRAVWCLDERRLELAALVAELEHADVETMTRAVGAAADLRLDEPGRGAAAALRLDARCRDAALLLRLPAPPTADRERVVAVRERLWHANALFTTGAYADALAVARESVEAAKTIDWPPLHAATAARVGMLLDKLGKYEEAEAMLESAYFHAADAGATEEALDAADQLVVTVGYRRGHPAEAERWWRHANVLRAQLPDPVGLREAKRLLGEASLRHSTAAYAEAVVLHERELEILERVYGDDHPIVARSLSNLAAMRHVIGEYAEAVRLGERALEIRERLYGTDHPEVAAGLGNLALSRAAMGESAEAARLHERALAIREKAFGPEHPEVASNLNNLAIARAAMGEHVEATRLYERALAIREKVLDPEHREVANSLANLATAREAAGEHADAVRLHERALAIREKSQGPEHPDVANSMYNLARVRLALGETVEAIALFERALVIFKASVGPEHRDYADALAGLAEAREQNGQGTEAHALFEEALAIRENAMGPEHPSVATPLLGLARIAIAEKRASEAVGFAERAVRVRENSDTGTKRKATAKLVLARALAATGTSAARAIEVATTARDALRDDVVGAEKELAEAEALCRELAADR